MSKPGNKTFIGIFVLGAIALLFFAVIVLGSGKFFRNTFKAVCFFEGSVGGLDAGAPVLFNGVRIGSITHIVLRYNPRDSTTTIPVYLEIDPRRIETIGRPSESFEENLKLLVAHGLRARLELQGLVTGKFQVGLAFYPERPARLVGAEPKFPEIPTILNPVQEIAQRIEQLPLEEIIGNMATALEGINRIVNSPDMTETIHSVSRAAEGANGLLRNLNGQVQPLTSEVQQTMREARNLIHEVDAKATLLTSRMDGAVKDVQRLTQAIDRQVGPLGTSLERTLAKIEKTSEEAGATLRRAQQTLSVLEDDLGEDSELVYELRKTVKEIGTAGKSIQSLAKSLERQPESILFGKREK
jgi:paraquat-inducible protein B